MRSLLDRRLTEYQKNVFTCAAVRVSLSWLPLSPKTFCNAFIYLGSRTRQIELRFDANPHLYDSLHRSLFFLFSSRAWTKMMKPSVCLAGWLARSLGVVVFAVVGDQDRNRHCHFRLFSFRRFGNNEEVIISPRLASCSVGRANETTTDGRAGGRRAFTSSIT